MKPMLRIAVLLVLVSVIGAGYGTVTANAFDSRAAALRSRWSEYEREGAQPGAFAALSAQLDALEQRQLGPVPYRYASAIPGDDALAQLEAATDLEWSRELSQARAQAAEALSQLELEGPSTAAVATAEDRFANASTPAGLTKLTEGWRADAKQLAAERQRQIEAAQKAEAARQAQLKAAHDKLVAAEGDATYYLNQDAALLQQYRAFGKDGSQQGAQIAQLQASLSSATTLDQVNALTSQAYQLMTQLNDLIAKASVVPPAPQTGGCLQNVPDKMIVVHLATQSLVAYDHGCVFLRTLVTTGRPALPTGMGTFQIFYKAPQYLMRSPWPPGSPYWYPNTWVGYAMEFESDGTFIHTAAWEPSWAYGPGSQYGGFASHGCVHVMDGPAATLYGWAPIGTTVIVEN